MSDPVEGISAKLQSALAAYVKEHRLPGATAGVVHDGALAWSGSVGFADVATRVVADPSTLHRVASITKTFTAAAILQLRDDGLLGLDDPVVAHIPELAGAQPAAGPIEAVTLRLLLAHQSGFQSEPPRTDWSSGRYEGDVLVNLARVAEIGTRVPVATQEKYSNLGYQLLGEVVARRSGVPFAEHLRTRITEPLGMTRTTLDPLSADLVADQATAYSGRWLSDELTPVLEPLEMSSSEGGLWSCVDDLARWAAFWLEKDDDESHVAVLGHATRREMRTPRYLADDAWTSAFGLGWYGVRKDDVVWVQHGGSLLGFRSSVCFDPKERVGAVVLINGMGVPGAIAMTLGALARAAVLEAEPVIAPPPPMPLAYADLLGIYAQAEVFAELVRIEWRDGALALVDPDSPTIELRPTPDPDVFDVEPGNRASGEGARFERAEDGGVRRFWIGGGSYARLHALG
jgi:CubicO group peptidase (beta-lactamase class C family)